MSSQLFKKPGIFLFLSLTLFFQMGCSLVNNSEISNISRLENDENEFGRSIASAASLNANGNDSLDAFEVSPDKILWKSENPESEIDQRLELLVDSYYLGNHYLKKFDEILDSNMKNPETAQNYLTTDAYARLLAIRDFSHRNRKELVSVYYSLRKMLSDTKEVAPDSEEFNRRNQAQRIFDYYKDALSKASVTDEVAFADLKSELYQVNELFASAANASSSSTGSQEIDARVFGSVWKGDQESLNFLIKKLQDPLVQSAIRKKVRQVISVATPLSKWVEARGESFLNDMKPFLERSPQSSKIYPDPGKNGNITGNTFPDGVWSLTFDDGPSGNYTPQVLDNLKQLGLKATFFTLARSNLSYSKMTLLERDSGMEVANHSYTHAQLTKLNDAGLNKEIVQSSNVFKSILGYAPKYFRCPYGAGTNVPRVRSLIASTGMVHVFWNVDSLDWQDKNPNSVYQRVIKEMGSLHNKGTQGGIILFHDIHPQSVVASKMVMEYLVKNHLKAQTIGETVDQLNHSATD